MASPAEPRATILIVEDHDDSRDAMGQIVTALGYRAVLAGTGAEALTVLQGSRPDLILCDVRMPGMDGFTFVKAVRSQPGFARVKLVAVTGLSDPACARLLGRLRRPPRQAPRLRCPARRTRPPKWR
jgi:CheY-like chemotaxis protein